ncbi:MAG TPA: YdeI/OmpD-associated family protein [Gemmatimonadaceae bacterium]|jgi:uncharacterized protein YdeI (YjbR/CyaY-like superfamily)
MKAKFFKTPKDFRAWLAKHHETEKELMVGFWKVESGKPSITWPQSVGEALSFGWIDGVRRRVDDAAYTIRFTPRKPTSIWSVVNIGRMGELIAEGRVAPMGHAAFARRDENRSERYSDERQSAAFDEETLMRLRTDEKAWAWYSTRAPWYQRVTAHWVTSAKRPETREKRLGTLIACSKKGERIPALILSKTPTP